MPAVWDESIWAVFGALLRTDGFSQDETARYVNCSPGAVEQALHVRSKGNREIWQAVVAREVAVDDAEALVTRFENDRDEQALALQRLRAGEIKELRHHHSVTTGSASAFQNMKRRFQETPAPDWSLTEEQVAEGIALAEAGLAEEAETWPSY